MTNEEFTERMQEISRQGCPESSHYDADKLMVEYLRTLGLSDAMDAFERMKKWYA